MKIGIDRLIGDLQDMSFQNISKTKDGNNVDYAVISDFKIPAGSFSGRVISLAIPAPINYPQGIGASMHIKSEPHLVPFSVIDGVRDAVLTRNVIESALGPEWQYWSFSFILRPDNPTGELIAQINGIFNTN